MTGRSSRLAPVGLTLLMALSSAPSALAHAYLVESTPAAGARVPRAPARVVLEFSEPAAPLPGTDVRGPGGQSVLRARAYRAGARSIVLPLERHLRDAVYVVRWHDVSADDGHDVRGSLQFAVGHAGVASNDLSQSGGRPSFDEALARWLLIIAVLIAGGFVLFRRLVLLPSLSRGAARRRESAVAATLLAIALAGVAIGAAALLALGGDSIHTAYGRRMLAGAVVAAAAGALAARLRRRGTSIAVEAAAVALLVLPSVTGHALGGSQDRTVSVPADLIHVSAAAFWIGGVAALTIVVPLVLRAEPLDARGPAVAAVVRRFAPLALGAVLLIAATGVVRAIGELGKLHDLWTTGYGRVLLAKSAVLGVALALAGANRALLRRHSRPRLWPELSALVVLVGLVALLSSLSPGRDTEIAAAATVAAQSAATGSPVVVAGHVADLAVGVSFGPAGAGVAAVRATAIGAAGPRNGLVVRFGGRRTPAARRCGDGCYRGTIPVVHGRPALSVWVALPGKPEQPVPMPTSTAWPAPDATLLLRRADVAWRRLHSLGAVSRIASDPQHSVTTRWRFQAPDRLAYRNGSGGASAVIIGGRRWDRQSPQAQWTSSRQDPVRQPVPPWTRAATSAHLLGTGIVDGRRVWRISFLDKAAPAWFTILVDRSNDRTLRVDMIAQSHFMEQMNSGFDRGAAISPPR